MIISGLATSIPFVLQHIGLIPHSSFHISTNVQLRCHLYISLVRSKLPYCSQLWRPHLVRDISNLERVQRRASKFILDYSSLNYKSRLVSLHLLPLMYWLELQDVMFLIKCLKDSPDNFSLGSWISFVSCSMVVKVTSWRLMLL